MSNTGALRLIVRTAADALIGLVLFFAFALAVAAHDRSPVLVHGLGDVLAIGASANSLLGLAPSDDGPLMAAATVVTSVPVADAGAAGALRHPAGDGAALVLLAAIVSALVAFNLAFFRHLRREYASPRRGSWRRGWGSAGSP